MAPSGGGGTKHEPRRPADQMMAAEPSACCSCRPQSARCGAAPTHSRSVAPLVTVCGTMMEVVPLLGALGAATACTPTFSSGELAHRGSRHLLAEAGAWNCNE